MPPIVCKNELLINEEYTNRVIALIDSAKSSVLIMMYNWLWYPSKPYDEVSQINHSIIRAARRGIDVRCITNFSEIVSTLTEQKVRALQWKNSRAMHAKLVIIDEVYYILGSHNFSQSSVGSNIEISMLSEDPLGGALLKHYFDTLWQS